MTTSTGGWSSGADLRIADFLVGVSLCGDVGTGAPLDSGLRVCLVATALARAVGVTGHDLRATFFAALLHGLGCTAHASENAAMFDDDLAFQRAFKVFDPADPVVSARQLAEFGTWAGPGRQAELARRFVERAPAVGPYAGAACREVSGALGVRLGLSTAAITALGEVYERFDGLGIPDGRGGPDLSVPGRIVAIAEQAVAALADGGPRAAVAEVSRRAGGHLDPDLCAALVASDALLAAEQADDPVAAVLAAEPRPTLTHARRDLPDLCGALAIFADLKGTHLVGHSTAVAVLVDSAAALMGIDDDDRRWLRCAALVHDVGRLAVPSSVWDRPGPLRAAERERVLLHPHWTARILRRCPALAEFCEIAAAHHERLDGSGYHRGLAAAQLQPSARLLAAADTFSALVEPRPHRPAHTRDDAATLCARQVDAGHLDGRAVAAVVEAAGLPRPGGSALPAELTEREVEVLRLAARGLTNAEIAAELVVSAKTVQHHLAHVYDKTGRRTRAGAAVFAVEHGLLPPGPR